MFLELFSNIDEPEKTTGPSVRHFEKNYSLSYLFPDMSLISFDNDQLRTILIVTITASRKSSSTVL